MKVSATSSKAAKSIVYSSVEEALAHKRELMRRTLSKVDPEQLKAVLNKKQ